MRLTIKTILRYDGSNLENSILQRVRENINLPGSTKVEMVGIWLVEQAKNGGDTQFSLKYQWFQIR